MTGPADHVVQIAADGGMDRQELEELALQLRSELDEIGAVIVVHPDGEPPPGARSVELIIGAVVFTVNAIATLASTAQIVDFVQRWRAAHPRRWRLQVMIDGQDLPASPVAPAGPVRGRRSALLIANERYDDPALSQLRSPAHDIRELADVLGRSDIGGFDVQLLTDAGEAEVRRKVSEFFADRDPDDVLLLHFSCHGLKDPRGRLHLAARNTELRALSATGVAASYVGDLMTETASRRVILILDCCYSGAFARGMSVRGDRAVHIADHFGSGTGRTVLTASSATEYAFEGDTLTPFGSGASVFTEAIVAGLRTGAADIDGDGDISVDELFEYAQRRVREAGSGQEPRKWAYGMGGALVVARSVRPAALPDHIHADLSSDRPVLRLQAVTALAGLLKGSRNALRQAAATMLAQVRDGDDSFQVRQSAAAALSTVGDNTAVPASLAEVASRPSTVDDPSTVAEPVPAVTQPAAVGEPAGVAGPVDAVPEAAGPAPVTVPAVDDRPRLDTLLIAALLALFGSGIWFLALLAGSDDYGRPYGDHPEDGLPFLIFQCVPTLAALIIAWVPRLRLVSAAALAGTAPWVLMRMGGLLFFARDPMSSSSSAWAAVRDGGWLIELLAQAVLLTGALVAAREVVRGRGRPPLPLTVVTLVPVAVVLILSARAATDPAIDLLVLVGALLLITRFLAAQRVIAAGALVGFAVAGGLWTLATQDEPGFRVDVAIDVTPPLIGLALLLTLSFTVLATKRFGPTTPSLSTVVSDAAVRRITLGAALALAGFALPLVSQDNLYWQQPIPSFETKLVLWTLYGGPVLGIAAAVYTLWRPRYVSAAMVVGVSVWSVPNLVVSGPDLTFLLVAALVLIGAGLLFSTLAQAVATGLHHVPVGVTTGLTLVSLATASFVTNGFTGRERENLVPALMAVALVTVTALVLATPAGPAGLTAFTVGAVLFLLPIAWVESDDIRRPDVILPAVWLAATMPVAIAAAVFGRRASRAA